MDFAIPLNHCMTVNYCLVCLDNHLYMYTLILLICQPKAATNANTCISELMQKIKTRYVKVCSYEEHITKKRFEDDWYGNNRSHFLAVWRF